MGGPLPSRGRWRHTLVVALTLLCCPGASRPACAGEGLLHNPGRPGSGWCFPGPPCPCSHQCTLPAYAPGGEPGV
jgi:hypothetical protein